MAAVDIDPSKLALAQELGAELTVNAMEQDPGAYLKQQVGGMHGVLVTAVSRPAFAQALGMARRGAIALNGLPPGDFPLPIFDTVLNGLTIRGSIVGTRLDLQKSLDFAAAELVHAHTAPRGWTTSTTFSRMQAGKIDGRIVLDLSM